MSFAQHKTLPFHGIRAKAADSNEHRFLSANKCAPPIGPDWTNNSHWPFGKVYCKISNFIAILSISASVFTLTAISCDR